MPQCGVFDPGFDWRGTAAAGFVPREHTIVYEAHVKGMTKLHPGVAEALRGTYAGLGTGEVIRYVKSLGVTSIDLLPVHTFVDDSHLGRRDVVMPAKPRPTTEHSGLFD